MSIGGNTRRDSETNLEVVIRLRIRSNKTLKTSWRVETSDRVVREMDSHQKLHYTGRSAHLLEIPSNSSLRAGSEISTKNTNLHVDRNKETKSSTYVPSIFVSSVINACPP